MAYIKELRNTAAILAIKDGLKAMETGHIKTALHLLREQFQAGKTGHAESVKSGSKVGFGFGGHRHNNVNLSNSVA